jgi:hypothetical protein
MPQDGLMYSVTGIENNQYSVGWPCECRIQA